MGEGGLQRFHTFCCLLTYKKLSYKTKYLPKLQALAYHIKDMKINIGEN